MSGGGGSEWRGRKRIVSRQRKTQSRYFARSLSDL